MSGHPEHDPRVRAGLEVIGRDSDLILETALSMMKADGCNLFPMDLFAMGAVKRHVSTAAALCNLIAAWNMVSARALLRLQIDTALRFSAAWLVTDPHELARQVIADEDMRRIKDSKGRPMTDRRLVEVRAAELPWLPDVYRRLSGYVHLSSSHIFASAQGVENETTQFLLSPADHAMPVESWLEVIHCFRDTSAFFLKYLRSWIEAKDRPPQETRSSPQS